MSNATRARDSDDRHLPLALKEAVCTAKVFHQRPFIEDGIVWLTLALGRDCLIGSERTSTVAYGPASSAAGSARPNRAPVIKPRPEPTRDHP